jgi:hypothetical protein
VREYIGPTIREQVLFASEFPGLRLFRGGMDQALKSPKSEELAKRVKRIEVLRGSFSVACCFRESISDLKE